MTAATDPAIDPVVAQVVRSRLVAITDQMRLALQAVSGSPTVTEASDFFTGLYLPDGSFATMGHQVTFEAPPVGALIRHLIDKGVPLRDGDRIIGNDPFVGALHQNDVQMCAPLLVDGEVIAWAGVMAHETDIGGMDFASWSPKATEIWQEGLRIPAVKLVDRGELREDVLEMILSASRLPAELGLDIRAFIATLNVASERLGDVCARYGTDVVQAVMRRMVEDAEGHMRERLRELPDAVVRVRDYLEHDGHSNKLYTVDLVATKKGGSLHLDFSGSSPQAMGFVNCSRAGLVGGVAGSLIPTLGFGMPWNDGLLRVAEIVAPDGLVCTAVPPAPVGSATVETIWVVSNVVSSALNRLLLATPEYAHRAQGVSTGTMATFNMSGRNQYGEKFGLHLMDPLAGGFGAFGDHDGQNAAGPINAPCPSIADVERNELKSPLFYLYRRLAPDTAGAGRRRGGVSAEVALTVSVPETEALVMTHGLEVPNSTGLTGGLPGSVISQNFAPAYLLRDVPDPVAGLAERSDRIDEFSSLGSKPGAFPMRRGDVFAVTWHGGGGIGDPLDRDPADVAADVAYGLVTREHAYTTYGVVFEGGGSGGADVTVDAPATVQRRRELRAARLGVDAATLPEERPVGQPPAEAEGQQCLAIGDRLFVVGTGADARVLTSHGAVLSTGSTRWRAGATAVTLDLPDRVGATLHADLTVTGQVCPVSGHLLAVDVHRTDAAPYDDLDLDLAAHPHTNRNDR